MSLDSFNAASLGNCLSFLDNVTRVNKRCIINYEFTIPSEEIPNEFREIINSPHINSINGEETAKFINEDDKKVRRQFIDIIKSQYLIKILENMKSTGNLYGPKNAAWKTRDSFYSMYRCNCKSQRLLDNEGNLIFKPDQFEALTYDKSNSNKNNKNINNNTNTNACKFPNVTSITDVMKMWIAENNGETTNFREIKKKTVSNDEMDQFFENFKHLEEENSYSSIEFLKNDEKFQILGTCPSYLSLTFKLSTLEFKLKVRFFPHDKNVEIKALKRKESQPRKKKVKLNNTDSLVDLHLKVDEDLPVDVEPILEQEQVEKNTNSVMDLKFINNDLVGIIKDK